MVEFVPILIHTFSFSPSPLLPLVLSPLPSRLVLSLVIVDNFHDAVIGNDDNQRLKRATTFLTFFFNHPLSSPTLRCLRVYFHPSNALHPRCHNHPTGSSSGRRQTWFERNLHSGNRRCRSSRAFCFDVAWYPLHPETKGQETREHSWVRLPLCAGGCPRPVGPRFT